MASAVMALACAGACVLLLHGCGSEEDATGSASTTTSTVTTTTTTTTPFWCPGDKEPDLQKPAGLDHNGASWRSMCADKTEAHFFGIGDWGGDRKGHTWKNPGVRRPPVLPVDDRAAEYVPRQMSWRAGLVAVDFVLNAGDNFYPGGYNSKCGQSDASTSPDPSGQFNGIFSTVYEQGALRGKPWFSVLGNHDYGGIGHMQGWDRQIFHTWTGQDSWRMPAQYWHQHVKYHGFALDFFMLDSNYQDAKPEGTDAGHNICNNGGACLGFDGATCKGFFDKLWTDSLAWLDGKLAKSTAEWKIIVTHFPGASIAGDPRIAALHHKYGIDLIFTGHQHSQELGNTNGIPWIVSGGGGGVTSDGGPTQDGRDMAYGFVDFTVNAKTLKADFYSWGGPDGSMKDIMKTQTYSQGNHSTPGEIYF